jgi:hypothetical protein
MNSWIWRKTFKYLPLLRGPMVGPESNNIQDIATISWIFQQYSGHYNKIQELSTHILNISNNISEVNCQISKYFSQYIGGQSTILKIDNNYFGYQKNILKINKKYLEDLAKYLGDLLSFLRRSYVEPEGTKILNITTISQISPQYLKYHHNISNISTISQIFQQYAEYFNNILNISQYFEYFHNILNISQYFEYFHNILNISTIFWIFQQYLEYFNNISNITHKLFGYLIDIESKSWNYAVNPGNQTQMIGVYTKNSRV